ncbi:MAG TPA: hypothetical protein VIO38_14270 [Rariglobus sp.]
MRFYVYALIDPQAGNHPFYIGKGLDNRLQSHFKPTPSSKKAGAEIVGCDTESILDNALGDIGDGATTRTKQFKIQQLAAAGYTHRDIARVVARRLDEKTAFALESYLIQSVYGLDSLLNRAHGKHSGRFRPAGDIRIASDFDKLTNSREANTALPHYVYCLINPVNGTVFYVGKGKGDRALNHFRDAIKSDAQAYGKIQEINRLITEGHNPETIIRILAWLDHEPAAFALEAFALKFVYGLDTVQNIQAGHQYGLFRAKGDWELRKGFDLPFVVEPGIRQDRSEKLDGMLGEGLELPLLAIQEHFPEIAFDPPSILDSADLGIEGDITLPEQIVGPRLKIFIRRKKIQIELRHRKKSQREWIRQHFMLLDAYPLRRADDVFFPDNWRGSRNMTSETNEAVNRVRMMLEIVFAKRRSDLCPTTERLLLQS